MSFVGIICEENAEKWIKSKIENKKVEDTSILFLEDDTIENVKNITFETLIIMKEIEKTEALKQILKKATYLIINVDIKNNFNLLKQEELTVITYGFNSKATITASSVAEESVILCIQRDITKKNGDILEMQEIEIEIEQQKVLDTLAVYSFLMLYEKKE